MQKLIFKIFTGMHTFIYRLSDGRLGGEMRGFHVLLLTTVGRKSGKRRTTPLGYFTEGGNYIIIASNGGLDTHPAWYFNIKHQPRVTIQVKDQVLAVTGETASPEERSRLWQRLIQIAPVYAGYEKQTKRVIPLVILKPNS
jgi:deazaflavin-dependent oxidoreductase (nitroreductase family)